MQETAKAQASEREQDKASEQAQKYGQISAAKGAEQREWGQILEKDETNAQIHEQDSAKGADTQAHEQGQILDTNKTQASEQNSAKGADTQAHEQGQILDTENEVQKPKKYRPNVAAIVLSPKYPLECKVLVAKRNDMKDIWQFPQGGIDENESASEALFRELKEEIGTDEVEIIAKCPKWLNYDFPAEFLAEKRKKYHYDGQSQRYFLVRLKAGAKIDLSKDKEPEFEAWQFVGLKRLFELITHFKRPVYVQAIKYFQEQGYL